MIDHRYVAATVFMFFLAIPASAQVVRDIEFPVGADVSYSDNYGDPRSGGRMHEGIDILGPKMTPLLAAIDGWVKDIEYPEPSWGFAITLEDTEGYTYHYLHVNNDMPGTDDGNGGAENAYAPGVSRGMSVRRGQLVGWMGDSGNAEGVGSHLHFEIRYDRNPVNPYPSLQAATSSGTFDPAEAMRLSYDIDADKELSRALFSSCEAGTLIKTDDSKAVYYCGADGRRYAFPNDKVYFSWYADFSTVTTVSAEVLGEIMLGGNVTYRPGSKMVKIQSDPKVYAVDRKGTLRWVMSPEIAESMYGTGWAKKVDDVSDAYFINYTVGDPVTRAF